ncbi:hypothetical protein B0H14DRAFT_2923376, partial [Mycena olivaceomarginata]
MAFGGGAARDDGVGADDFARNFGDAGDDAGEAGFDAYEEGEGNSEDLYYAETYADVPPGLYRAQFAFVGIDAAEMDLEEGQLIHVLGSGATAAPEDGAEGEGDGGGGARVGGGAGSRPAAYIAGCRPAGRERHGGRADGRGDGVGRAMGRRRHRRRACGCECHACTPARAPGVGAGQAISCWCAGRASARQTRMRGWCGISIGWRSSGCGSWRTRRRRRGSRPRAGRGRRTRARRASTRMRRRATSVDSWCS